LAAVEDDRIPLPRRRDPQSSYHRDSARSLSSVAATLAPPRGREIVGPTARGLDSGTWPSARTSGRVRAPPNARPDAHRRRGTQGAEERGGSRSRCARSSARRRSWALLPGGCARIDPDDLEKGVDTPWPSLRDFLVERRSVPGPLGSLPCLRQPCASTRISCLRCERGWGGAAGVEVTPLPPVPLRQVPHGDPRFADVRSADRTGAGGRDRGHGESIAGGSSQAVRERFYDESSRLKEGVRRPHPRTPPPIRTSR